jgi:PhnB protein
MPVDPIPPTGNLVPSLVCTPCADAIDWYVEVFGAVEVEQRLTGPDGTVAHAELELDGARFMLGDEWPDGPIVAPTTLGGTPGALFLYRDDARQVFDRALEHGAEEVFPYELQFYGHEGGRIRDPFGHMWGIGKVVEHVSDEEMQRRMRAFYED